MMVEYGKDLDAEHFDKLRDLGFNLGDDGADDTSDCDRDDNVRVRLMEAIGGRPQALTTKWGANGDRSMMERGSARLFAGRRRNARQPWRIGRRI